MVSRTSSFLNGFGNVVEGADAHRLDGALDRGVGGDDDHHLLGIAPADLLQNLHARHAGEHQVEQHEVDRLALGDEPAPLRPVRAAIGLKPSRFRSVPRTSCSTSSSSTTRMLVIRRTGAASGGAAGRRQLDDEAAAQIPAATLDQNAPAVLLDDVAADGETQTRASLARLRGVERLENSAPGVALDPGAVVLDTHADAAGCIGARGNRPRCRCRSGRPARGRRRAR